MTSKITMERVARCVCMAVYFAAGAVLLTVCKGLICSETEPWSSLGAFGILVQGGMLRPVGLAIWRAP